VTSAFACKWSRVTACNLKAALETAELDTAQSGSVGFHQVDCRDAAENDMGWRRIAGYGFILWLAPFLVAFVLFGVRQSNRALFESLITVTGVACAVAASLLFFRNIREAGLVPGLEVGFAWAAISVLIDLPIFLNVLTCSCPSTRPTSRSSTLPSH